MSALDSANCFTYSPITFICFSPWFSIVFVSFLKTFPKGGYINLAFSVSLLGSGGSTSLSVRSSYLSILPVDKADIFAASLLILYCGFSFLTLSPIIN